MKKIIIVMLVSLLFVCGCSTKKTLKCNNSELIQSNNYETNIKIKFKNKKINKYELNMKVKIDQSNMEYFEYYYNSFADTFENYKEIDGIKVELAKEKNSYNVKLNVDYNTYKGTIELINQELDYGQAKKYYEDLKYTCK